jgi:hypothetical protein
MRRILTFSATILITATALAAGDVYRWKDANGTWHYSDQPQPGAELVVRGSRPVNNDTPATDATPAPAAASTAADEMSGPLPVSDAVASQVRQEAATAKAERCKVAEKTYQDTINHDRLYRVDEAGNQVFYTAAEIDAVRLEARRVRDLACAPGN